MGRTIPSFRIASSMEYAEWKDFRRALPKADRKLFDDIFSTSVLYNSVCVCCANPSNLSNSVNEAELDKHKQIAHK
jgi:hypothetical protein